MKKVIVILVVVMFGLNSCDKCRNVLDEREVQIFKLVFQDKDTNENLFTSAGQIYDVSDFQLFYKGSADTLVKRSEYNYQFDNEGFIIETSMLTGDNITTFYYKLEENHLLDTLSLTFNEIEHECLGTFKESYDLFINGELMCDDCTHEDFTIIYK